MTHAIRGLNARGKDRPNGAFDSSPSTGSVQPATVDEPMNYRRNAEARLRVEALSGIQLPIDADEDLNE